MGNTSTEAEKYVQAGPCHAAHSPVPPAAAQAFVQAETECRTLNAAGFHENIIQAQHCYQQAIEVRARAHPPLLPRTDLHAQQADSLRRHAVHGARQRAAGAAVTSIIEPIVEQIFGHLEDATRFFDEAASLFDEVGRTTGNPRGDDVQSPLAGYNAHSHVLECNVGAVSRAVQLLTRHSCGCATTRARWPQSSACWWPCTMC